MDPEQLKVWARETARKCLDAHDPDPVTANTKLVDIDEFARALAEAYQLGLDQAWRPSKGKKPIGSP